jgi:hypothetical protein
MVARGSFVVGTAQRRLAASTASSDTIDGVDLVINPAWAARTGPDRMILGRAGIRLSISSTCS